MPDFPSWFTHLLAAGGGGTILTVISHFILKYRKQSTDSWQALLKNAADRISALEARLEKMQDDHIRCIQTHAELMVKVAVLEQKASHP